MSEEKTKLRPLQFCHNALLITIGCLLGVVGFGIFALLGFIERRLEGHHGAH